MDKKLKILLVEDSAIARKFTCFILNQLGFEVIEASTGKQALALAHANSFDLIFMDLGLPDIQGDEITKSIRKSKNKNSKVPIVALTAHSDPFYKRICSKSGMNDFLIKPINNENASNMLVKLKLMGDPQVDRPVD